jgi:predicted amidohydrolase
MKTLTIGLVQGRFRNGFREKIPEVHRLSDFREGMGTEDFDHNHDVLLGLVRSAASDGAQMVVTPESYLDGWSFDREILDRVAVPPDSRYVKELRDLAAELGVWICAGLFMREDDRIYNSAILIDSSGSIPLTYRKTHETNGVMEKMPYDLGNELSVVETPWGRVGILVCHDRWYPECYRTLRLKGAEIILNPVAAPTFWPGHTYFDIHRCTLRSHAYGNALFLASCNSADHGGHSVIVAPDGTTAASAGQGEEVLVTRLDPAAYSSYDFTTTRRPMIY